MKKERKDTTQTTKIQPNRSTQTPTLWLNIRRIYGRMTAGNQLPGLVLLFCTRTRKKSRMAE